MNGYCNYLMRDNSERLNVPCAEPFRPPALRGAVKEGTRLTVVVDFDVDIR
jgi:hypothetical protein